MAIRCALKRVIAHLGPALQRKRLRALGPGQQLGEREVTRAQFERHHALIRAGQIILGGLRAPALPAAIFHNWRIGAPFTNSPMAQEH